MTVLGASGGYAGAGKACSSFLIENGNDNLVLDLGSGSLSNLLQYKEPDRIDTVAISHMHFDHYADLYNLLTARRFWHGAVPQLKVVAPSDMFDKLACLISPGNREELSSLMEIKNWDEVISLSGFNIRVGRAKHSGESWIMRIETGENAICYSGDTEPCDNLYELAAGVDLFICDSTFTSEREDRLEGHMFASQAAQVAERAEAKSLLLTHLWPTLSASIALEDARAAYHSSVKMAQEHTKIEL